MSVDKRRDQPRGHESTESRNSSQYRQLYRKSPVRFCFAVIATKNSVSPYVNFGSSRMRRVKIWKTE